MTEAEAILLRASHTSFTKVCFAIFSRLLAFSPSRLLAFSPSRLDTNNRLYTPFADAHLDFKEFIVCCALVFVMKLLPAGGKAGEDGKEGELPAGEYQSEAEALREVRILRGNVYYTRT